MSAPFIKAMAKKHHKTEKEVSDAWDNAKGIVEREYDSIGGKFGLVAKITKRILKIKESISFSELILAEDIVPLKPSKTTAFLQQWSRGDMIAASRVDDEITAELSKTVQDPTYTLYRGWKFGDHETMYEKMGFHHHDMVVGKKLKLKVEKLRSWTKSKKVAENFADPKFDSINDRVYSDHELDEMGMEHGELIGLSVIIQIKVKAASVFADLTNAPTRFLEHAHNEEEVILKAGDYTVTILDVASHVHDSPAHHKAETLKQKIKLIYVFAQSMYRNSAPIKVSDIDEYILDEGGSKLLDPVHAAVFLLTLGFEDSSVVQRIKKLIQTKVIRDQVDEDGNLGTILVSDILHFINYITEEHDEELSFSDRLQSEFAHFAKAKRNVDTTPKKDAVVDLDNIDSEFDLTGIDWEPED